MILIWIGSRANYGRLYKLIEMLIAIGYEIGIIQGSYEIEDFKENVVLKLDNDMRNDTPENMVISSSIVAQGVAHFIKSLKVKPRLAIVHADRFENLGFAYAMSYVSIPLLHTEGGEDSGNIDDKIRDAISALADYHCVTTKDSEITLRTKSLNNVYFTGSPAIDYVKSLRLSRNENTIGDYYLVLYNPCPEDNMMLFVKAIEELAKIHKIIWVNPNVDPGSKDILKYIHKLNVEFVKNLRPHEYYKLLNGAKLLIGNTSSGIKEGAYLGVPYILVGNRQSNRETCSNVFLTDCDVDSIVKAVIDVKNCTIEYCGKFGVGNASKNMVKVIEGIVNEN